MTHATIVDVLRSLDGLLSRIRAEAAWWDERPLDLQPAAFALLEGIVTRKALPTLTASARRLVVERLVRLGLLSVEGTPTPRGRAVVSAGRPRVRSRESHRQWGTRQLRAKIDALSYRFEVESGSAMPSR